MSENGKGNGKRHEKSINEVLILGRLGQDPELKYTTSGAPVATISIATNESWKDKESEEWQEKTEWHQVILWGRLAEIADEYMGKGDKALIRGRLQTRKYDKDGVEHWITEIVARELFMLGSKSGSSEKREAPLPEDAPAWVRE